MKFSAFLATSLDGFIADESHGISWLEKANELVPKGEDCGYNKFFASVDALVMGRRTFEQAASFPEWPYGNTPVYVLSSSLAHLPVGLPQSVSLLKGAPVEVAAHLSASGFKHVYVDGGFVVQSFIAARLLHEITITLIPVTLGGGVPLFGAQSSPVWFTLLRSKAYPFGFVQNTYRVS
jgi:dihydrofolate reductase